MWRYRVHTYKEHIMIQKLILTSLTAFLFIGCGGTTGGDDKKPVVVQGKYNLWEYMTPNTSNTNTFNLSSNSVDSKYTTTYKVERNRVVEVADYAQGEETIYEKFTDKIIIKFKKGGKPNGFYEIKLTANINDVITKRSSSCRLSKHHDNFTIAGKSFQDVIEITCGSTPGFYQKGVGEIAQIEDDSGKNLRVLSN